MGTSKNFASPDTPPWRPALAVLGRLDVPVERQTREIWRSASAERGHRLLDEFSSDALAAACGLAAKTTDVHAASRDYDAYLSTNQKAGFAVEIGKRALVRAVASKLGSQGFANELFAEATAYYASRDLPSFVGAFGRIKTPSQSIQLKSQLKAVTRTVVAASGAADPDPMGWASYVQTVISKLRSRV